MNPARPNSEVRFSAGLSTLADTLLAIGETCDQAMASMPARPDLALVFVSSHHGPDFAPIARAISDRTGATTLIGCTGESIVGGGREIEGQPALSLWLASMPGVSVQAMHLKLEQTAEGGSLVGWPDDLPDVLPDGATFIVLGEPFSFPTDVLLERLAEEHPGVPVVGGMASGGWSPGQNRLLLGRQELDHGAVAVLLSGPIKIATVVSQGCRPIGRHFVITKAERNVIQELSGEPPLARLEQVLSSITPEQKQQVQHGLHVGRVINEYQDEFRQGDFLVRNVVGADPGTGAIAVGDYVRVGQTVQFHIRDAETADEELRRLLGEASADRQRPAAAALLFTCNGRGSRLFSQSNHDAGAIQNALGEIPIAGFFAQGEIGPVGGKNFVHGFTASVVLFD